MFTVLVARASTHPPTMSEGSAARVAAAHDLTFLRVHCIRHGQSSNNVLMDRSAGSYSHGRTADAHLSDIGIAQARATGRMLAQAVSARSTREATHVAEEPDLSMYANMSALYCSAMLRAVHTASEITHELECAGARGLPPRVWVPIHEVGGIFATEPGATPGTVQNVGVPGMSATEILARFPHANLPQDGSLDEAGWWRCQPVETPAQGAVRMRRVLATLRAAAADLPHLTPEQRATFDVRAYWARTTPLDVGSGSASPASTAAAIVEPIARSSELPLHATAPAGAGFDSSSPHTESMSSSDGSAAPAPERKPHMSMHAFRHGKGEWSSSVSVGLVCHGDALDLLLHAVLSSPTQGVASTFLHHNCAITTLDIFPDGVIRVVRVNDVSHLLAPRLLTGGA
ncbi:hypothetical protein EON67_03870 [archaeon]|nr:MAG: hypothetical protein EON67_03870 [archaeon]